MLLQPVASLTSLRHHPHAFFIRTAFTAWVDKLGRTLPSIDIESADATLHSRWLTPLLRMNLAAQLPAGINTRLQHCILNMKAEFEDAVGEQPNPIHTRASAPGLYEIHSTGTSNNKFFAYSAVCSPVNCSLPCRNTTALTGDCTMEHRYQLRHLPRMIQESPCADDFRVLVSYFKVVVQPNQ